MSEIDTEKLMNEVNTTTKDIATNVEIYKKFLSWSGRFMNYSDPFNENPNIGYSIANQILIYSFNNKAKLCYTEKLWNRMGISVQNKDSPIYVIKHVNGKEFIPEELYDISDTNAQQYRDITGKDIPSMCEALLISAPCDIRYVKNIKEGKILLSEDGDSINVTNGFKDFENIFITVSQELSHYYIYQNLKKQYMREHKGKDDFKYRRSDHYYETYSAAYAVSSSMYLPVTDKFNIGQSDKWKCTDKSDLYHIRNSLSLISSAGRNIVKNVTEELIKQKTAIFADTLAMKNENMIQSEVG